MIDRNFYRNSILLIVTILVVLVAIPRLNTYPMEMKIEELKEKGVEIIYCEERWADIRQSKIDMGGKWLVPSSMRLIFQKIDQWIRSNHDVTDVKVYICKEDRIIWMVDFPPGTNRYMYIEGDRF